MREISRATLATLDLFWHCYCRTPGLAGWGLVRTGYPRLGGVEDQDGKTMWAFEVLEAVFYTVQGEMAEEGNRARELAKTHSAISQTVR